MKYTIFGGDLRDSFEIEEDLKFLRGGGDLTVWFYFLSHFSGETVRYASIISNYLSGETVMYASIIPNYFSGETVMEWMAENRILSVVLEGNIDQVER